MAKELGKLEISVGGLVWVNKQGTDDDLLILEREESLREESAAAWRLSGELVARLVGAWDDVDLLSKLAKGWWPWPSSRYERERHVYGGLDAVHEAAKEKLHTLLIKNETDQHVLAEIAIGHSVPGIRCAAAAKVNDMSELVRIEIGRASCRERV